MGLETGSTIASLITSNPTSGDPVAQGDDHIRLIKSILQAQFPGSGGLGFNTPITVTESELNVLHNLILTILPTINGYSIGTNTPVLTTDTLLAALGKLQAQVTARGTVSSVIASTTPVNGLYLSGGTINDAGTIALAGSVLVPDNSIIVTPSISGAIMTSMGSSVLTQATSQAAGTVSSTVATVSFTGIPTWAKRITMTFVDVQTVSNGIPAIVAGSSGTYDLTGYSAINSNIGASTAASAASATTSWDISKDGGSSNEYNGQIVITKHSGNTYTIISQLRYGTSSTTFATGSKTFTNPIGNVQLRMSGTSADKFNGGSVNVIWE